MELKLLKEVYGKKESTNIFNKKEILKVKNQNCRL
jgi:hypothetical protein